MHKQRLWADLTLFSVAVIWGSAFVVQRIAAMEIGVFIFNGSRFLVGALVILPLAVLRITHHERRWRLEKKPLTLFSQKNILAILAAGLIMTGGSAFQQAGLKYTTAGNAGFITGLYVVLIPILLTLIWRRRPRPMIWVAALFAVVGLFLLSTGGQMRINLGDALVLVSAVFWAFHVLLISWSVQRMDAIQFACGQYLVCGLTSLAIGLILEPVSSTPVIELWRVIAYMGIISVGLGYTLQAVGQRVAPPADAAIILSLEAVMAAFFGWIFLGESLAPLQLLGCGIMLAGMLLAQSDVIFGARRQSLNSEDSCA